eukprot:6476720-Amphidinium_carterae.1
MTHHSSHNDLRSCQKSNPNSVPLQSVHVPLFGSGSHLHLRANDGFQGRVGVAARANMIIVLQAGQAASTLFVPSFGLAAGLHQGATR